MKRDDMKFSGSKRVVFPSLFLAVVACACYQPAFSTDFSIDAVYFNEKMPLPKSSLDTSLVDPAVTLKILGNDANVIKSLKSPYTIKIVGHTDNQECAGRECEDLSLRRAQLVYNWMLTHGVPRSRLLSPEGRSGAEPVANNELPNGRARTRYVEFQVAPSTPQP
jgi:OOP family OmpA-OmpF porin